MEILLIGLSHRSAPLEVRERLWFPPSSLTESLRSLMEVEGIEEGMILSTCNRTEILGVAGNREDGFLGLDAFLERQKKFSKEEVGRYCYRYTGKEAVRHVFRVASSLDSMVVGEPQILGQVKEAYQKSCETRTVGPILDHLLRKALSAAKRVRTDTEIARNPVSISYAAAQLARQIFDDLSNRSILLVGSGRMSELAGRYLIGDGVREVYVANRTYEKAVKMARKHHGTPIRFDQFFDYLRKVDVVLTSTAAPHWIIKKDDLPGLMRQRRSRPIFFIDIAVPRDVEPSVNEIENVYLYGIDDLQSVVDVNMEQRRREASHGEQILEKEVGSFQAWLLSRDLSPTIVAFREQLHSIRKKEIRKYRKRLGPLSQQQEQTMEEMSAAIVNKILHHPIQWLKRSSGEPDALQFGALLKRLFAISDPQETKQGREEKEKK